MSQQASLNVCDTQNVELSQKKVVTNPSTVSQDISLWHRKLNIVTKKSIVLQKTVSKIVELCHQKLKL